MTAEAGEGSLQGRSDIAVTAHGHYTCLSIL
jgi:hypothetical protein